MAPLNILIAGGGIAGPVAAFWLRKLNANITIVERDPSPRYTGQAIDLRGPAVQVVEKMGLKQKIKELHTSEKGFQKIDSNGNVCATFDATGDESAQTLTSEFEILRGELAQIFFEAIKDEVKFIYGDSIQALDQHDEKVTVTFKNNTPSSEYDLVVAADGLSSRTRSLVTGRDPKEDYNDLESYVSYCTIPRQDIDSPTHARFFSATGRRCVFIRPTRQGQTAAYFAVCYPKDPRYEEVVSQGPEAQKQLIEENFKDAGWETERYVKAMRESDDFYYQKVAQTKVDRWSYGRVVLLGDAGFAPSPFTGMGTSTAVYAAYVLAGEISKSLSDIPAGLQSYEKELRPYVEKVQKLMPGTPWIINPETEWGISLLNGVLKAVAWSRIPQLTSKIFGTRGEQDSLPQYDLA